MTETPSQRSLKHLLKYPDLLDSVTYNYCESISVDYDSLGPDERSRYRGIVVAQAYLYSELPEEEKRNSNLRQFEEQLAKNDAAFVALMGEA